jgi:hypothetical protein
MKVIFKNKTYKSYQDLLDREYKDKPITLLTAGESNAKMVKGITEHLNVMLMHLLPHDKADILMERPTKRTVCAFAIAGDCWKPCLNTAGRGGIIKQGETTNTIELARLRRTNFYWNNRKEFLAQLYKEIYLFTKRCEKNKQKPCIRLNGTSDIQWEYELYQGKNMFEHFPEIQFYDYTKIPTRKVAHIENYHLTWSYSEANEGYAKLAEKVLNNIAVVFRTKDLPSRFRGRKVIDGDKTDMRFLDEPNVIVGLKAKGQARKDTSGFVIDVLQIA